MSVNADRWTYGQLIADAHIVVRNIEGRNKLNAFGELQAVGCRKGIETCDVAGIGNIAMFTHRFLKIEIKG